MLKWKVFTKTEQFRRRIEGSDPNGRTCRGKLQSRRSKLNMAINKELRLRSGAENLYRVSKDAKTKENVSLELSFVNSNLQLLKEQLAELNSSVELYQDKEEEVLPMIPLGLKETQDLDLRVDFKQFIKSHYYEEGDSYEEALASLMDLRQAMRTPSRNSHGVALLFKYYNQLHFVERRFFKSDKTCGRLHFHWYDSLTGAPSSQKTIAYEKACVLFNTGCLYTQVGARQDRTTGEGLDTAVDNFMRAAGIFEFIKENFNNAPSSDLEPECLVMLVQLMLGQATECLFEKTVISLGEGSDIDFCLELSQEAAHISSSYDQVLEVMVETRVKEYLPYYWLCLVQIKREHYRALADYYLALGLVRHQGLTPDTAAKTLQYIHHLHHQEESDRPPVPRTTEERNYLGKSHLRESLLLHEEALRLNRMCPDMKRRDILKTVLKFYHERSLSVYQDIDDEDDFQEVFEPPTIVPSTKFQLSLSYPDFSGHPVTDLFHMLGPESVFSAKHWWSPPMTVQLTKKDADGYGLALQGSAPVLVVGVEQGSLAQIAGIKEGDYLVGVGEKDVKWDTKEQVLTKIKNTENHLRITLVTPVKESHKFKTKSDENDCSLSTSLSSISSSSSSRNLFSSSSSRTSFSSSSTTSSSGSEESTLIRKRLPWFILRKNEVV